MNEATCKAALCKLLRASVVPRGGIVYRHEDTFTGGIPDISVNLGGRTVWAEVKLSRPGRRSKVTALQHAALTALCGVLVEYAVDKGGNLSATVSDFYAGGLERLGEVTRETRATVHKFVAASILRRL